MQYTFRVLIDAEEEVDVFRDIVVNANDSFSSFHEAIIHAFDFEGGQMASFYLSDDEWNKGDEVGLMDMSGEGSSFRLMDKTTIKKLITEANQKMVYVYDFLNMWCFFVELIKIDELDEAKQYPYVALSFGTPPSEDSKNIIDDFLLPDESSYDLGDEYDDSEFESFENIDDLDI